MNEFKSKTNISDYVIRMKLKRGAVFLYMYSFGEEKVHIFECVVEEEASFGTYYLSRRSVEARGEMEIWVQMQVRSL